MRRQRTRAELAKCVKYFRERRHQEALINLNKLIEEKPDLAEAYQFRGASMAAVGDLDRAAADFKEAARLNRQP
jgi:Tfp pilus assembly protein PilF